MCMSEWELGGRAGRRTHEKVRVVCPDGEDVVKCSCIVDTEARADALEALRAEGALGVDIDDLAAPIAVARNLRRNCLAEEVHEQH